jgi:hypothetical protein
MCATHSEVGKRVIERAPGHKTTRSHKAFICVVAVGLTREEQFWTAFRQGRGALSSAMQLAIVGRAHVAFVVLIEVVQYVVDVDGGVHVLFHPHHNL